VILGEEEKPTLDDLVHNGVKGMKWGVRKSDHPGVSRSTNKAARKDAQEFARAKMFYGEGAGTRRKLIKAKVEQQSKVNSDYKKAFDHHLGQQDMGQHADKARSERGRKNAKASVGKNVRAVNRAINGPFASGAAVAIGLSAYGGLKASGLDKKLLNHGSAFVRQMRTGTKIDLSFLNN
jgi:hypothetical protein